MRKIPELCRGIVSEIMKVSKNNIDWCVCLGWPGLVCELLSVLKNGFLWASGAKIFTFLHFFYLHPNPLFSTISVVMAGVIPNQITNGNYGGIYMRKTSIWGSEKRG